MNLSTFKTRLLLNAKNLKSSHPFVSNTNGGADYINAGQKFFILRAAQRYPNYELFPEHKDTEWVDVTIADQNYMTLPSDGVVWYRFFSADSSSNPNLSNTNWREVGYIEPRAFDLLAKPTTDLSFPFQWTLREGRVYMNPTPRTNKTTYVKLDGIQDEVDLVNATDTPRTNVRWHEAILACGSYLLLTDLGWHDDAAKQLEKADQIIQTAPSLMGLRRQNMRRTMKVQGAPRGMF